jgi:glycosyltransferase involved in cell wall biosynthesis
LLAYHLAASVFAFLRPTVSWPNNVREVEVPDTVNLSPSDRSKIKRSILVVSNVFPPQLVGGAEIVAQRQAKALADQGFDVSVLAGAVDESATPVGRLFMEVVDGLRVFRFAAPPVGHERSHRRPELEEYARAVLRLVRPDVVHLHNVAGLGAGLIPLAKAAGAHVTVTMHDTWGFCLRQTRLRDGPKLCESFTECDMCLASVPGELGERLPVRLRRDYVRWCLERADYLLFPSRSLEASYATAGLPVSRFVQLSNGVDLDVFRGRQRDPKDQVAFLCVSALAEHKGVRVLWDALELLLQDQALSGRWRMMLGGEGPLAPELRARFTQGALRAPVYWAGFIARKAIPRAIDRADIVVLASICPENQPVSLLEAVASGAALLGSRIGGIPELIEEGKSGLLVEPNNVAALAAAMRRMILNPSLVHAFSARNLTCRSNFDETKSIAQLTRLFSNAAAPESVLERPIVICWGEMADIDADSFTSRHLRQLDDRLRLLWHGWVDSSVQMGADVLCIFGDQCPAGAVGRAILSDKPIVVPRHMSLDLVPGCKNLVHPYDTEAEALDMAESLALAGRDG